MGQRADEDRGFDVRMQELLQERSRTVAARWREDMAEAEAVVAETSRLHREAYNLHTEALERSRGVRRAIYKVLGWRGERPQVLKDLDADERVQRDNLARLRGAEIIALGIAERYAALGELSVVPMYVTDQKAALPS